MNLTKWFNGKFLLQNLKKSKGILAVLILIIPILTSLIIISENASIYDFYIDEYTLSAVNLIGMYIVPFIISVLLTGYIYKRNSVDFINSMPINRKTIYFTNFVGGILVILSIQALTLATSFACAKILTEVFVPIQMIIDIFTVMLISYIFVFSVSMLAQTVSGNIVTQIVVVALILFLIPFSHFILTNQAMREDMVWKIDANGTKTRIDEISYIDYTMPFKLISSAFGNIRFYDEVSMSRMIVLSVMYLIIGMQLFEKRKMENVGTSFVTLKSHYFVKGLTLVPMVFTISFLKINSVWLGIAITLMAIYYVLYDFVVSKKVKIKYTIVGFVLTVVILVGVFKTGRCIFERPEEESISINDISGVGISTTFLTSKNDTRNGSLDLLIQDRALIEKIFQNTRGRYHYSTTEDEIIVEETKPHEFIIMKIKLNNGKEICGYVNILSEVYDEAVEYLSKMPEYEDSFKYKEMTASVEYKLLPEEDIQKIKEALEKRNYNLRNGLYNIDAQGLEIALYESHSMKTFNVDLGLTKDIFEIITRNANNRTYELLNTVNNSENFYCHIQKYSLNSKREFDHDDISLDASARLINYVKNHYQEKCDFTKEFISIRFYIGSSATCYINTNDEINQIIKDSGEKWSSEYEDEDIAIDKELTQ